MGMNGSSKEAEPCMLDQVLLRLLNNQDAETVPLRLELQYLHWEIRELEVILHTFLLLLSSHPSVDEA